MYKMIIADDESMVRDSLIDKLNWTELQIEIIGVASDGEEAYDMALALKPDILLTDIRMPHLDGLELSAKLRDDLPDLKIIIVSGYSDFTYAKTALELDITDYILKPIEVKKLTQVIRKVLSELDKEKDINLYIQDLKDQMSDFRLLAIDKFLVNLLLGTPINNEQLYRKCHYLKLPFEIDEQISIAVIEPDTFDEISRNLSEDDLQLLIFSFHNITSEIINNYEAGFCVQLNDTQLVVIFKAFIHLQDLQLNLCHQIQQAIRKYLNHTVSIGIGYPVNDISQIQTGYTYALKALQYRFYTGKESINFIDDFDTQMDCDELDAVKVSTIENDLFNAIQLGDNLQVKEIVEKFHSLIQSTSLTIPTIRQYYHDMVSQISRHFRANQINHKPISDMDKQIKSIMINATIQSSLTNALRDYCIEIASFFFERMEIRHTKMIEQIRSYIDKNYMNELSISTIAEHVFLTPNYVSLIFKQTTQMTVIEYITKVRIEKAKELLKSPDLKIFEIAEMVGYPNPRYFSKVFKKVTNLHPSQYKEI
ncbi:MAG: AraC family transcriptional regulator [Herbinix sp.]|jgi:two-component system response regulator YesN|nr:AraC family transcriptional regulator [Herbinix sp.]